MSFLPNVERGRRGSNDAWRCAAEGAIRSPGRVCGPSTFVCRLTRRCWHYAVFVSNTAVTVWQYRDAFRQFSSIPKNVAVPDGDLNATPAAFVSRNRRVRAMDEHEAMFAMLVRGRTEERRLPVTSQYCCSANINLNDQFSEFPRLLIATYDERHYRYRSYS